MTAEDDQGASPKTPHRDSASKPQTPNATPNRKTAAGVTPKSAPAGGARRRSATMKAQPTLLGDFLLGRPSPARIAAEREAAKRRRMELEQVKKEMKEEMRQSAMQRVQPPGGVRDRVKQWQKANAAAMAAADPLAAPSEPSEIHIQVEEESVTEEDRVRIKLRQKKKKQSGEAVAGQGDDGGDGDETEKDNREESKPSIPPKKRVVSDTNWMKNRKKSPPRNRTPNTKQQPSSGSPLPKDFLARAAPNPTVKNKIKDWAAKVEIPDESEVKRHRASRSVGSGDGIRVRPLRTEEDKSSWRSDDHDIVAETSKENKPRKSRIPDDDGIRIRPSPRTEEDESSCMSGDHFIVVETIKENHLRKSRAADDDGIRINPTRKRSYTDHGIRVQTQKSTLTDDDGIRVYSTDSNASGDASTVRASSPPRSRASTRTRSTHRTASPSERIEVIEDPESDVWPATPTRRSSGKHESKMKLKAPVRSYADTGSTITGTVTTESTITGTVTEGTTITETVTETATRTMTEDLSDTASWSSESDGSDLESDMPSSIPSKLAEIPVGYSAFSELNLPSGGSRAKQSKTKRTTSFKDATNVLKKALTEGKKILTEKAEPPPKPVANQPRSIESWLNKTVDPFVEASPTSPQEPRKSLDRDVANGDRARRSLETDRRDESRPRPPTSASASKRKSMIETHADRPHREDESRPRRSVSTVRRKSAGEAHSERPHRDDDSAASVDTKDTNSEEPQEPPRSDTTTPTSNGLKRSRAIRSTSSPIRPNVKKGFKDKLMDAFRGESSAHKAIPTSYPSGEEEIDIDDHYETESYEHRRRSSGSRTSRSSRDDESSITPEPVKPAPTSTYPKRRPPTRGFHELSTIASEVSRSTAESDLSSMLSETTVTQTTTTATATATATTLTKSTGSSISRNRSNKHGLKRRLTKHSDLVSVLSLPDDHAKPGRSHSLRSAHSVRRTSSHLNKATVAGLFREFADDENLYQRELKTLVDGVIPVLLTQVVHGDGSTPKDLFDSSSGRQKDDSLAKSAVQMGIALEKLRNAHKRCPLSDVHRLPHWLETVYPTYDHYLDVWRLGFQDLIVNLAPLANNDNDSLINALPRNEEGDVLNEDGERIDVAHLLKRPLVRVKWIAKFVKGYQSIAGTSKYDQLVANWEALHQKTRQRHKEESARVVDDDAINTDTTRVRDLRTLGALDNVKIDRYRQVYAKDFFSLDLQHSNGQRLGCQVELISRDNQYFKSDRGDLLIRETGSRGRSWLLFAPIPGGQYSARKGDEKGQLVVMIRGKNDEWFELLTLKADNEEQVMDWLDILGTCPEPPAVSKTEAPTSQALITIKQPISEDIPLGERRQRLESATPPQSPVRTESSPELKTKSAVDPYRPRYTSLPSTSVASTPDRPRTPSNGKTVTPDAYMKSQHSESKTPSPGRDEERSRPLREDMRPDPLDLQRTPPSSTPYREDGAPPPPAHRSLPTKKSPTLLSPPPVDLVPARLKRRGSSPLKHEYHPSDVSSEGETSEASTSPSASEDEDMTEDDEDDEFGTESSDDELEAADMPDTIPAISIKRPADETPTQSVVSESTDSLTPSASASQANLPKFGAQAPAYAYKSIASISYWDNRRGCWKDLWPDVCSIVTTPGLIEAYPLRRPSPSTESMQDEQPLIALDLTPLVMLRNSTVLDLEIRSPVLSYARLYSKVTKIETSFFRFRSTSFHECEALYMGVHRARMDNAKYKALEEEARVRAFGQNQMMQEEDGDRSARRRSWFGRKNSYRVSARAPSQSQGSISLSSSISASSFLKRLMGGNQSFDIGMSSVDRQSRSGSGDASLYTSSSGASPRSPSVSAANSGRAGRMSLATNNLKIRLHLLVSASKWEDHGNCYLEITRPDQGTRQNLRTYQGLEKRVIVTSIPKKNSDKPIVVLDVVLGSRCFSRLGSRGILLNVWEEVRDEAGAAGVVPKDGGSGGMVNKWCFQCASVMEAGWIYGLVTQEVVIA